MPAKPRSIRGEGDLVVTRAQLNRALNAYSEKVSNAVKLIEDRQTAFEDEVRKALLAVEDETAKRVAEALAVKKPWWQVWR